MNKNIPLFGKEEITSVVLTDHSTWYVVEHPTTRQRGLVYGEVNFSDLIQEWPLVAIFPNFYPAYLGNTDFLTAHTTLYPYIVGEMANGIASAEMVIAAAQAQMLSFFGAGGLVPEVVEKNILNIKTALNNVSDCWGANLIHSPNEPAIETAVVDLYLRHEVKRVSASAYFEVTPNIVHYAFKGIKQSSDGIIERKNHVLAKISRTEVAKQFMLPPSSEILHSLLQQKKLTSEEAEIASRLPIAEDITAEADSGGHTDNRAALVLFPLIYQLAAQVSQEYHYKIPIRVGLAGGIGCPEAVVAAFSMGAAYVMTGTINESAVEAGISKTAKEMLSKANMADVMMAAAADMFEQGVKLQILKRGTMFGERANKLYGIYKTYSALEDIPEKIKISLEQQIFSAPLEEIWQQTKHYFNNRDPQQVTKAEKDSKYKMALVFRWYLGQSSRWAIHGVNERALDYQIWCGPCVGSFNEWIKGSYLEELANRSVVDIGLNLLSSAVQLTRIQQLKQVGIHLPINSTDIKINKNF